MSFVNYFLCLFSGKRAPLDALFKVPFRQLKYSNSGYNLSGNLYPSLCLSEVPSNRANTQQLKINHKKWNQLLSLYSDSSFRCSSALCSLFTCLSNVIFHFRVFGRTSPIGERDTICGGATAKKKQKIAQRQTAPYL